MGAVEKKEETAIATIQATDFRAVEVLGDDKNALIELIEANIGENMTIFDLPKVTVPSGGATFFSVKTASGTKPEEFLEGSIMAVVKGKGYWEVSLDDSTENTPPDCRSYDCVYGVGKPGGKCAECSLNVFGSAKKGEGKACRDRSLIIMLTKTGILPLVLQAPPTSLGAFKEYGIALSNDGKINWKVLTRVGLRVEKKSGKDTAILTFKMVGDLPGDMLPFAKNYRENIDRVIEAARKQLFESHAAGAAQPQEAGGYVAPEGSEEMPDFESAK